MAKAKKASSSISSGKVDLKRLASTKKTLIDTTPKTNTSILDDEDGNFKCVCCDKVYKRRHSNFPKSSSILFSGNLGYVPYCFTCLDTYFTQCVEVFQGDEKKALERVCQLCDWYYCDEAADLTARNSQGHIKVSLYPKKMNIYQIKQKGVTYQDTIKDKLKSSPVITHTTDMTEVSAGAITFDISPETINFFGYGYEPWQYKFLQDQYDDWTARYECKTKAQEEIFKNICIAQLNINLAQQGKSGSKVVDAQKAFQDLLGSGNLKPSQSSDNSSAGYPFGVLIEQWEQEQPIPEPDPELNDIDNIKTNYNTWIVGHLCKLLHIQNDAVKEYEEELAKYTAYKPTQNDGEAISPSDIFDKFKEDSGDEPKDS